VFVEDIRIQHHGGGIAAKALTRESVDEEQAAFALGHGQEGDKDWDAH
jgi:hypothetical protein